MIKMIENVNWCGNININFINFVWNLRLFKIVDFFEIKPIKCLKHCHNKLVIPIYLFIYFQENCGL
jgi:hypothetical protein